MTDDLVDGVVQRQIFEARRDSVSNKKRRSLLPVKYELQGCTNGCSVNPRNLPPELARLIHEWYEEGRNNPEIQKLAERAANVHLSTGALHRHRTNHMVKVWEADARLVDADKPSKDDEKKSHISILETMIQRGADNLPTGRISPELLLKAMDMHFKMTQGSAIDATLNAIKSAMSGSMDDDGIPVPELDENPDALESEEEQQQTEAVSE